MSKMVIGLAGGGLEKLFVMSTPWRAELWPWRKLDVSFLLGGAYAVSPRTYGSEAGTRMSRASRTP